ncbi:hypothetical protein EB796_018483 [Bugula neritina]|uniref:Uncharacterized protein n=1 Tax=Bugula neritina TaxID=10212 RepID=A0A7J7JC45_BUGNE|nr:hypothetical protein EB796_018483 [Bugula neritina]
MVQLWSQVIGAHQSDADQHHQAIDALNSRKMESKMPKGSKKSKVRQKMDVPHTDRLSGSKPEVSCKKYPLKIAQGRTNVVKKCGGSENVLQKPVGTEKSKLLSPRHQNVSKRCKGSNLADRCRAEEAILQANEVRKSLPKISRSSNYINQMEDILMSIKASASTQPELLERVNQCLRDRRLKRSSASSDLDKLECVIVTADSKCVIVTADSRCVIVAADSRCVIVTADSRCVIVTADGKCVMVTADSKQVSHKMTRVPQTACLSAVSPSIKEEKPYSEGPPIPSLQLKSDCSSASKQSIDCVPVKEPEIKPAKSAPKVFLSVWSGLPADDKPESAVADMQGRQPPKSTTTPDAQLTPGRADNSKTQSAPKSMSKLGVMVLPTTSSNIASVPRTFNSAKDETSIVPPSLIKAEVKAKKEFIDKVVNPGRDSDRKETGEETSGDNSVGTNSQPPHPASSKPEISRSSALPSAANREAGSSVYSLDSTFKDGHLPQKPPRKKHLSRSSSIVDGVTSPRAFLYSNSCVHGSTRLFSKTNDNSKLCFCNKGDIKSFFLSTGRLRTKASFHRCLRRRRLPAARSVSDPKELQPNVRARNPSFTMPSSTRYERCPHCGSLPYSLSRETLQPSHPSRFRENTRSEPGKSLAKGGKERSRCGSCKSSQESGVAQWMSPHVDLWVQGQTNAESNFNNSAAYMKDGCVRESNTSQVRKQLSKPSVKKSLRSYAGGARQRRRPSSPHPDLCCFQRTQTSRDSSVKNT